MKRTILTIPACAAMLTPAFAAMTEEECTAACVAADANKDGTLDANESFRYLASLRVVKQVIDVERVLGACAEHGVAVEINANPWRLDLDWRWHVCALELGCMFSINPDAHSTSEIDLTRWGVSMARKVGSPPTGS